MYIVNCKVSLNGDRRHVVPKENVTVAEVFVLRHIHGGDAVFEIQPVRNDRRSHAAELERLRLTYKPATVDALFPGANPRLPSALKDIGLEASGNPAGDGGEDDGEDDDSQTEE